MLASSRSAHTLLLLLSTAVGTISPAQPEPPSRLPSTVFEWDNLPVASSKVGVRRRVCNAETALLQKLESHVTTLKPGLSSHPPHRHAHEEILVVKEGLLEVNINGKTQRAGPGSVIFYAANDWHNVRNVGDTMATYHVFAIHPRAQPDLQGAAK